MASKRVSLKGRGADLFFGDEADSVAAAPPAVATAGAAKPNDEPAQPTTTGRTTSTTSGQRASARTAPRVRAPRADQHGPADPFNGHAQASRQASTLASALAPPTERNDAEPAVASSSVDAGLLASPEQEIVDGIRKVIRSPGREVSFVRLTPAEKDRLVDIVYTYKRQGWKTSENEINRIAVNYLIADFEAAGELSVLARVLKAIYTS